MKGYYIMYDEVNPKNNIYMFTLVFPSKSMLWRAYAQLIWAVEQSKN